MEIAIVTDGTIRDLKLIQMLVENNSHNTKWALFLAKSYFPNAKEAVRLVLYSTSSQLVVKALMNPVPNAPLMSSTLHEGIGAAHSLLKQMPSASRHIVILASTIPSQDFRLPCNAHLFGTKLPQLVETLKHENISLSFILARQSMVELENIMDQVNQFQDCSTNDYIVKLAKTLKFPASDSKMRKKVKLDPGTPIDPTRGPKTPSAASPPKEYQPSPLIGSNALSPAQRPNVRQVSQSQTRNQPIPMQSGVTSIMTPHIQAVLKSQQQMIAPVSSTLWQGVLAWNGNDPTTGIARELLCMLSATIPPSRAVQVEELKTNYWPQKLTLSRTIAFPEEVFTRLLANAALPIVLLSSFQQPSQQLYGTLVQNLAIKSLAAVIKFPPVANSPLTQQQGILVVRNGQSLFGIVCVKTSLTNLLNQIETYIKATQQMNPLMAQLGRINQPQQPINLNNLTPAQLAQLQQQFRNQQSMN